MKKTQIKKYILCINICIIFLLSIFTISKINTINNLEKKYYNITDSLKIMNNENALEFSYKDINDNVIAMTDEDITNLANKIVKKEVIDDIYPVGSIYMSTTDDTVDKVEKKFGGTWEKFAAGTKLISANATYPINTTGGKTTVNISHSHGTSSGMNGTLAAGIGAVNSNASYLGYASTGIKNSGAKPLYLLGYANSATGASSFSKWNHHTAIYGVTAAGGSTALNIINPYTSVYMYKRTA